MSPSFLIFNVVTNLISPFLMRLSRTRIQDLCKQNNIQVEEIKGNKLALAELLSNKNAKWIINSSPIIIS